MTGKSNSRRAAGGLRGFCEKGFVLDSIIKIEEVGKQEAGSSVVAYLLPKGSFVQPLSKARQAEFAFIL